jgi:hypothetical protein
VAVAALMDWFAAARAGAGRAPQPAPAAAGES